MSGATIKKVAMLKAAMSKKVPSADSLSDDEVESLRDMLQQLDAMEDINLAVLSKTLIGTVVSKFKKHSEIGPTAKALVKKWKAVAKEEAAGGGGAAKAPPKAAAAPVAAKKDEKPPPPKRRNSTNAATAEMQEAWSSLQPHRSNTCRKLHDVMEKAKPVLVKQGINADALDHLAVERATDLEASIQTRFAGQKQEYIGKARSLCFNLKKNSALVTQLILGQITSNELVLMTPEQLLSTEKRKEAEAHKKALLDANMLDWEAQNEDKINEMCGIKGELLKASLFTCHRCKSTKTTSTQKQTRSADEPMTVFVLCLNCNYRWKFS